MKKKSLMLSKLLIITFLSIPILSFGRENFVFSLPFVETSSSISDGITGYITPEDTIKPKKEKKKKDKPEKRKAFDKKKVSFETFDKNYERAMKYYQNQQFLSAARLFEELYPLSFGTPYADTILFSFADCYFQNKDYELSALHFKDYARRFPGTKRSEEAYFRCVQAIYNVSPYYSLDQFETKYAIEEINLFIQIYPHSQYVETCNAMLDELRDKLAQKDFEIVKLYYNTENYKATQIAVKNFLKEYSYSKYASEAMYILVINNLAYAKKSVPNKQRERYLDCVAAYESLQLNYPDSPFVELSKSTFKEATKQIDKTKKQK